MLTPAFLCLLSGAQVLRSDILPPIDLYQPYQHTPKMFICPYNEHATSTVEVLALKSCDKASAAATLRALRFVVEVLDADVAGSLLLLDGSAEELQVRRQHLTACASCIHSFCHTLWLSTCRTWAEPLSAT